MADGCTTSSTGSNNKKHAEEEIEWNGMEWDKIHTQFYFRYYYAIFALFNMKLCGEPHTAYLHTHNSFHHLASWSLYFCVHASLSLCVCLS